MNIFSKFEFFFTESNGEGNEIFIFFWLKFLNTCGDGYGTQIINSGYKWHVNLVKVHCKNVFLHIEFQAQQQDVV
jgi:hypothetical protein